MFAVEGVKWFAGTSGLVWRVAKFAEVPDGLVGRVAKVAT